MSRHLVIDRLAHAAPGRRSAPGTTPETTQQYAGRSDYDLNPGMRPNSDKPLTAAAVLVPLIERPEGMTVLLTKRTDHLHDHAGQVSFPGGKVDPADADAAAAALREAEEEVGLPRHKVDLVGQLDIYVTRTGFEVTPWVGLVMPPFDLKLDAFEVAEVFEVPLAFFLDPANRRRESRVWQGQERFFYVYPWPGYYIWGATAGMLNNLAEVLAPQSDHGSDHGRVI
jgi:8-oxo-dGTP pyrophosphatase MutT (NUDIX family)